MELLNANLTPKRLLFCMYSHVLHYMILLCEALAANLTPMQFYFSMHSHGITFNTEIAAYFTHTQKKILLLPQFPVKPLHYLPYVSPDYHLMNLCFHNPQIHMALIKTKDLHLFTSKL